MREFDLRSLLEELNASGVRFVVIGGVAVGAHGYVRATEDLDLVPDRHPENLGRLTEALMKLESTLPMEAERTFDAAEDTRIIRRGENLPAMTRYGMLDIVQRAPGVPGYSQLIDDAIESEVVGVPVLICSLGHLREMKLAQDREQDRDDLANLPEE